MIPQKIHYCWFGRGEKPALALKCIESWKTYCPDYELIEWNEDNFDLDYNAYTRYCYNNKKWAFLSDFVRLAVVHKYGGLYFDTDVELLKSPDHLLEYEAFYSLENSAFVNTGQGFGSIANHPTLSAMLELYQSLQPNDQLEFTLVPCPKLNTEALLRFGLVPEDKIQNLNGVLILPSDYMNPFDDPTGKLNKTRNTISIHWYSKSWLDKRTVLRSKLTRPFHRLFGIDCFRWLHKK